MDKPEDVFDRDHEWRILQSFVASEHPGTALGLVYGRRRQGKTYLLESLAETHGGFYFVSLNQSGPQNLARLSVQYLAFTKSRVPVSFGSWEQAIEALLALGEGSSEPVVVVLDEFTYLLEAVPELPSALQALLSPRRVAARRWKTRLILCGSALSTMRRLLVGTAPLRGRAGMELMVHPFDYRDAAKFWGVASEPDLAMRLHALIGGTAGYLDMCNHARPSSDRYFDSWVVNHLLDPASAMFREGNILLSEEEHISETAPYFSVLSAISAGRTRRSEIAAAVGRSEQGLGHPLGVLTSARLVDAVSDAIKQKRTTYHVAEPVLRLHHLVIAPNEARLGRRQGAAVWAEVADTVSSRIYGPHFEHLARQWCLQHASSATLGGTPGRAGPTAISCRTHKATHDVDVVVIGVKSGAADRVLAIGEAKWTNNSCGTDHIERLEHLRHLLGADEACKLMVFSRSGFTTELFNVARRRSDVELVDVERIYAGQ